MTIVSQHEIYPSTAIPSWILLVIMLGLVCIGTVLFIYGLNKNKLGAVLLSAGCLILCLFAGFGAARLFPATEPEEIDYVVIFDDNYTVKELYEKYEIISVDGDLFTIREKEG